MPGPRGEACERCYFWAYEECHHEAYASDSFKPFEGWWCSGFRPHPDHACERCRGTRGQEGTETMPNGMTFRGFYECSTCHGAGLRPEKEQP